jgi:TonB-linked SusC/RagA family outer membrane protein
MKQLAFLFSLLCLSIVSFAQERQIKGRVTDDAGIPLAGVSVIPKGLKTGVQTDKDGNFTITVGGTGNVTLTFSSTGHKPATILADGKTTLAVQLEKNVTALEDVVVIGYTSVKRKDLLASVSSISAKDLKDIPINNIAEALNGRLAGVTATTSEGSPDANVRVRIRGGMSITGSNDPLYVIDGVQVENGLSAINPQDIQTIDVLKDAAATAIYGARGANGVIIITTKSGKPGRTIINYNGFIGVRKIARVLEVLNPYDFIVYQAERSRMQGGTDSIGFLNSYGTTWDTLNVYKNYDFVDWQEEVFGRTGINQTHNVTASGGGKKLTFNLGYTYNRDKAIVLNSSYNRHLFNLKADYKITSKLKVGTSSRYSNLNVYGAGVSADNGSSSLSRLRNAVKYRPYTSNSQEVEDYTDPSVATGIGNGLNLANPIKLANAEFRRKTTNTYNVTLYAQYTILRNLTFKSTFSIDRNEKVDRQFYDTLSPQAKSNNTKPFVSLDTTIAKTITNSNVLTYSFSPWKDHNFDFVLGEETYEIKTEQHLNQARNFPYFVSANYAFAHLDSGAALPTYPRLNKSRSTQLSFFGRIGYNYKDKYLFSANLRRDGSSKFAPKERWGYFPAGSIAWRITKEKFMSNVAFINEAKLRFGYGTMGNNRINDYLYLNTFINNTRFYGLNGQVVNAYVPSSLPNESLKWEATVNRNWGLDLSLFNNRLNMSVDYYINSSKDLLLNVNIDPTYGFTTQLQNIGKTENKGWEFQFNGDIIRKAKGLNWTASLNLAFNKNKVVQLGPGQTEAPQTAYGLSGASDYMLRIGQPLGTMYGLVTNGFYTPNDFDYNPTTREYTLKSGTVDNIAIIGAPIRPGSIKHKDISGPNGVPDGKVDLNYDRTIIGNPNPKVTGGLSQQFNYKNWDLSLFVNFMLDFDVYNANRIEFTNSYSPNSNLLGDMKNRWRNIDPATGESLTWTISGKVYGLAPDRLSSVNANAEIWQPLISTGAFTPHSWAIEDGSFLRFNNLTVGYSLPIKSVNNFHMSKLRFYFTANNLAIITNYSGYDPEVSVRNDARTPNLDYSAYPKSRSYIFGVNATF